MKKMIMHVAEKKANKIAKAMGVEGLGKDGAVSVAMGLGWMLIMWALCWVA